MLLSSHYQLLLTLFIGMNLNWLINIKRQACTMHVVHIRVSNIMHD